jgi:hypothetical protein
MTGIADTLTRPAREYTVALRDMIEDRDRSLSYEATPYRRMALQQDRDRLATLLAEHERKTGEAA